MTILTIQPLQIGVVPVANPNNSLPAAAQTPSILLIATNDTNATVTTAGYLNALQQSTTDQLVFSNTQIVLLYTTDGGGAGVGGCNWYQIQVNPATGVISLVTADNNFVGNLNVTGSITAGTGITSTTGNIQALAGNVIAGSNTHAGSLNSFPAGNNLGSLRIAAANSAGNTVTLITNASQAGARIYTIPDGGQAASSFLLTDSGGTQTIATGNLTLTAGNLQVTAGTIVGGTSITAGINNASAGSFVAIPAGNNQGTFQLVPVANAGGFNSILSNTAVGQATTYSLPDPGAATANVLLDTGAANSVTDCSAMLPIENMMLAAGGGAWTLTRNAQGDWGQVHTIAANTSVLAFDITEYLRAAAGHGFELTSFDISYTIGAQALLAHSLTLNKIVYSNNLANAITQPAITSVLATATQAQPYLTNSTVNAPAFLNPAAGTAVKFVLEITVQADAASTYTFQGVNLRFTRTIK